MRVCGGFVLLLSLCSGEDLSVSSLMHAPPPHLEQSLTYEEADGAIATAQRHIVQEQSHIIETLNLKLANLKAQSIII